MPILLTYLLKLSISLAVVFLFYRFILRPLTFYNWNRWYLLGYSLMAFVIPFVDINSFLSEIDSTNAQVINFIPAIGSSNLKEKSWLNFDDRWTNVLMLIGAGVVIMLVRLSIQLIAYARLRRSSKLLSETPVKVFEVEKPIVPFSFGNSIFINRASHAEHELKDIILHEFVHIRQRHTVDMIWAELLCILNWYNPFAWMIKKVICQNLEFIADQQVLNNGLDKKEYQYLLLKVAGGASFRITKQFNFSFLKKRIAMMNKMKSAKINLVRFLFVLPLLAVLLLSFREKIGHLIDTSEEVASTTDEHSSKDVAKPVSFLTDTIPQKNKPKDSTKEEVETVIIRPLDSLRFSRLKMNKQPLYIINGVEQDVSIIEALNPNMIKSIDIIKDKAAAIYGEKGKYGVISITTRRAGEPGSEDKIPDLHLELKENAEATFKNGKDTLTMTAETIVIGRPLKESDLEEIKIDASLDKDPLKEVVVTGYGTRSRAENQPNTSATGRTVLSVKQSAGTGDGSKKAEVLIIIDGVRQPRGTDINNLDANTIESVSVLKSATATSEYGEDAANGVVIIKTKKSSAPDLNPGKKVLPEIQIKARDSLKKD